MSKRVLTLLLLVALVILPSILLGFYNEKTAKEASAVGNFERAALNFELAAKRHFWKDDLWNQVGEINLNLGKKDDAIKAFEKAKPLSALGWDALAQAQWEQGDKEKALSLWQKGLLQYPDHFEFYARLAMFYREKGDFELERNAIENWLKNRNSSPEAAPFHYRLGLLLCADDPDKALDELTLAARLDEKFAPVVETLSASLHLALLESDLAQSMILRGRGLALAEEWLLAAEVFRNATQAQPKNASAWAWLGEAKQHLGADPLPDLDKALDLQSDSVLVRSLRGLYFRRQGSFEEALSEFEMIAELEPENPSWQSALGEIYASTGDLPPALSAYQKAVSLEPENSLYLHLLALFSVQYGVEIVDIGLPAVEKALVLRPDDATFLDTLGRAYFDLNREEEAEEAFLRALEMDPDLAVAYLHLGILYLKKNHLDLAYNALLNAREFSSDVLIEEQAANLLKQYFSVE